MRPRPVSTRLIGGEVPPRDAERGLRLLVRGHEDIERRGRHDVPGGHLGGRPRVHGPELAAGDGVALGHAAQPFGQGGQHGRIPLRVDAELPVGDLVEQGGVRHRLLGCGGIAERRLGDDDLLHQPGWVAGGRRRAESEHVDGSGRGRGGGHGRRRRQRSGRGGRRPGRGGRGGTRLEREGRHLHLVRARSQREPRPQRGGGEAGSVAP